MWRTDSVIVEIKGVPTEIAFWDDYGIWPKLIYTKCLTTIELQEDTDTMPEELKITPEQWEEMLRLQMQKQQPKAPTRTTHEASKPYKEKSFVSVHYDAAGSKDNDSAYSTRDASVYVVLHFYLRDGDTWPALLRDARDYAQTFHHSKIIVHDHAWNEPCSPAPKLKKCKEV